MDTIIRGNKKLSILLSLVLLINIVSHFFENVIGIGNTYIAQGICWIILFVYGMSMVKSYRKRFFFLFVILIINTFLPILGGSPWLPEFHIAVVVWCSFYFSMCMKYRSLSQNDLFSIFELVVTCGVVVCFYAIIASRTFLPSLIVGGGNPDEYVSFLRHRNVYAAYCYLCSIPALYLYFAKKKKKYMFCLIFFITQIFLTTSRNALLCLGLFIGISYYLKTKKHIYFYLCLLTLIISVYFIFGGFDSFYNRFRHENHLGTDSSEMRYVMWLSCVEYLNSNHSWISGFGIGNVSKYLLPSFDLGSSHCTYIDVVFWGGIVLLTIMMYALVYSFRTILNSSDNYFKIIMIGAITSYVFYCIFEAGMILFFANFLSITSTILLIVIPLNYRTKICKDISKK